MLQIKDYIRVKSLDEAYELNQKKNNVIIGGMHWLKMSKRSVGTAIDMSDLGLDKIEESESAFEIGAFVSLRELELNESLNAYCDFAVRDAVRDIVGVQFRNTATIGGSIFGRYGFSDVLTVFLAMDTYVECYKSGLVPLEEYAQRKADRDIIVKLVVKKTPLKVAYMAQRHARTDFPMLTCGLSLGNKEIKVAVGARPHKAAVVRIETCKEGQHFDAEEFAKQTAIAFKYGTNMRASAEYRQKIARVLIKRALLKVRGL